MQLYLYEKHCLNEFWITKYMVYKGLKLMLQKFQHGVKSCLRMLLLMQPISRQCSIPAVLNYSSTISKHDLPSVNRCLLLWLARGHYLERCIEQRPGLAYFTSGRTNSSRLFSGALSKKSSRYPEMPVVISPGNVGDDQALGTVYQRMNPS